MVDEVTAWIDRPEPSSRPPWPTAMPDQRRAVVGSPVPEGALSGLRAYAWDLLDRIWPDPPTDRGQSDRLRPIAAVALTFLALAVAIVRLLPRRALDVVWAEDGRVFLAQNLGSGLRGTFFEPFGGYMHAVPRLAFALITLLPSAWTPAAIAVLTSTVVVLLAWVVFHALGAHIRSLPLRLGIAGYLVGLPVASEVVDVVANLHFYLPFVAFCVLLWRPRGSTGLTVGCLVLLATTLSDPFGALLLPVALLRLVHHRDRQSWLFAGVLTTGFVLQSLVMVSAPARILPPGLTPVNVWLWFEATVLSGAAVGDEVLQYTAHPGVRAVGLGLIGVCAAVFVAISLRADGARRVRPLVGLCALGSVTSYVTLTMLGGPAARYTMHSVLLLVLAAVLTADGVLDGAPPLKLSSRGVPGRLMAAVCILLLVSVATSLQVRADPYMAVSWSSVLANEKAVCAQGGATTGPVAINPPGWTMTIPCTAVARS